MLKPSVARVHRLAATAGSQILEEIGTLDAEHKKVIKEALRELLKL